MLKDTPQNRQLLQAIAEELTESTSVHYEVVDWKPRNANIKTEQIHLRDLFERDLYIGDDGGRLVVTGEYPTAKDGTRYWPSEIWETGSDGVSRKLDAPRITVAGDSHPHRIASEILRRFLPDFERIHGILFDRARAKDRTDDLSAEVTEQLSSILHGPTGYEDDHRVRLYESERGSIDCKVYGESVDIDLRSIPAELARKVAKLFYSHLTKES
jgi:hypothetical protein